MTDANDGTLARSGSDHPPFQRIKTAREGSTLIVTLSVPERRNAIGPRMTSELLYALDQAHRDDDIRVVVITGEGKVFCAGGDFAQMTSAPGPHELGRESELESRGDYADLLLALWRSSKPVVAKVNGHAMGGGLGLVAASTFAVAAEEALLGTPEIEVGLFPMMIMAIVTRLVPRRRLLEMMLTGERMTADEGARVGLLNRVVPREMLDQAVRELAEKLAQKSPVTVRLGLRALAEQEDLDIEHALPLLRGRLGDCLATEDAREGMTAFLEKRKPRWTGK